MRPIIRLVAFSFSLLALVACSSPDAPVAVSAPEVTEPEAAPDPADAAGPTETLVDEQGAVVVSVTPLTLDESALTLDFEVAMNTHSVDLSMDLAQLASVSTDGGQEATAGAWSAPLGGHHVSGILSFPAQRDGRSLLAGATRLTLTLEDVDASIRTFTWTLD